MRRNTFALVTALIILFSLPVFAGKDDKYFNRFMLHLDAFLSICPIVIRFSFSLCVIVPVFFNFDNHPFL